MSCMCGRSVDVLTQPMAGAGVVNKEDLQIAKTAVKRNLINFRDLLDFFKDDKEFVLDDLIPRMSYPFYGDAHIYAIFGDVSKRLRGDKEVVLAAVKKNPHSYEHITNSALKWLCFLIK